MAGSIEVTDDYGAGHVGVVRRVTVAWTCNTGGSVSGLTTGEVSGCLGRVDFAPGTPAPNTNYSAQVLSNGVDLLGGLAAGLSNTATNTFAPLILGPGNTYLPPLVAGPLGLTITNAGNTTEGTVTLYLR